ncbi:MAG TPA: FAD-dependent oxidoreductase [Acidimicrobiales bacterium]|jgi:NADPH-dependent 2,4-dienoyl-CoA reductase/sulfur reductase-like enzyme
MGERLVVIGGDAAGMSAASQARRLRPDLQIVALEKGGRTSYSACGIPYLVSGAVDDVESLVARTPQEFRDRFRIDVRLRHEAVGIDLDARTVEVRDLARDRTITIGFDQLMVGTGARPIRPALPGIDLPTIHGVQTLEDGERLLEAARRSRCERVVVVGAGYIGLEMAEAFVERGAEVTVVEGERQVMRTLDEDMADLVAAAVRKHGIDLHLGTPVIAFEPGAVLTADGRFDADLVVLGLGVRPNSELAADAGLATGVRGAIVVNRRQQASADGVWAAGDCAESFHLVSQRNLHIALGTVANKQGRVAGVNIGGGYATFPGVVGTAVTKVCSTEVARTGLTEREAAVDGFRFVTSRIESTTRAGYFPGAAPITVKLVAERETGRLLGGQIVGEEGAAKRIDVLATALSGRMTVHDLVDLDLSYAPPFAPVWDPVLVAARSAAAAVDADRR